MTNNPKDQFLQKINDIKIRSRKRAEEEIAIFKISTIIDEDIRERIVSIKQDMNSLLQSMSSFNLGNEAHRGNLETLRQMENSIRFWVQLAYIRNQKRINYALLMLQILVIILTLIQVYFLIYR